MAKDDLINENVLIAFVDTSALDPMFNDYSHMEHQFAALKKHIDSHKLILLTHEIAIREMERHIWEEVSKQLEKLVGVQSSKELALLRHNKKYDSLLGTVNKEIIIADSIKSLKTQLKEIGIIILKTGTISVKDLVDDYFLSRPPFGAKNKKSEFPDAIMFQSLIRAIGKKDRIHIVAKDGDWENLCKTNENLIHHKNLAELLDYINKDNVASSAIKAYLISSATSNLINDKLFEIVSNINFEVDGLTYDRKGLAEGYQYDEVEFISADDIRYQPHTIEDIECSNDSNNNTIKAIVTIVGSANVTLKCSFFNEGKSAWDSETHEYVWQAYDFIEEVHEFLFPVRLTITGIYDQQLSIEKCQLILTPEMTQLDYTTLIERNYITDYDDYDIGFQVKRILPCPHCGKDIKVDLISDSTDCVSSSERQMGIEREYNVDVAGDCPHCNGKYKITGAIWEYPENCCNYEQDIKISKES